MKCAWCACSLILFAACGDRAAPVPSPTPVPPTAPSAPATPASASSQGLGADLSAMPSWAHEFGPRPAASGLNHRSTVAQHQDPASVFGSLTPQPLGPFHGMLVCRTEVTDPRNWDSRGLFGANVEPDVTLQFHIGGNVVTVRGPEDRRTAYATIPNVRLNTGDVIQVNAVDRDLARDDAIETVELPIPQLPAGVQSTRMSVECRAMPMEQARLLAGPSARLAAQSMVAVEAAHPSDDLVHIELPAQDNTRRHLFSAAVYLGWAHPEVGALVTQLDAAQRRFQAEVAALVETKMATLPALGAPVDVGPGVHGVRIVGATCTPNHNCRIELEATYESAPPVDVHAVSASGARIPAHATRHLRNGTPVLVPSAPGTYRHHIELSTQSMGASSGPERARILVLRHTGGNALLRLER
jgi:hypothetical protein